jgi:hypothetical protein
MAVQGGAQGQHWGPGQVTGTAGNEQDLCDRQEAVHRNIAQAWRMAQIVVE